MKFFTTSIAMKGFYPTYFRKIKSCLHHNWTFSPHISELWWAASLKTTLRFSTQSKEISQEYTVASLEIDVSSASTWTTTSKKCILSSKTWSSLKPVINLPKWWTNRSKITTLSLSFPLSASPHASSFNNTWVTLTYSTSKSKLAIKTCKTSTLPSSARTSTKSSTIFRQPYSKISSNSCRQVSPSRSNR